MKPSEVLSKAADLIEPEGAWTQGAFGRDSGGNIRPIYHHDAACFCALGAVARAASENPDNPWVGGPHVTAREFLEREIVKWDIASWNDARERAQIEVVKALRDAAELAKEEGQ